MFDALQTHILFPSIDYIYIFDALGSDRKGALLHVPCYLFASRHSELVSSVRRLCLIFLGILIKSNFHST